MAECLRLYGCTLTSLMWEAAAHGPFQGSGVLATPAMTPTVPRFKPALRALVKTHLWDCSEGQLPPRCDYESIMNGHISNYAERTCKTQHRQTPDCTLTTHGLTCSSWHKMTGRSPEAILIGLFGNITVSKAYAILQMHLLILVNVNYNIYY